MTEQTKNTTKKNLTITRKKFDAIAIQAFKENVSPAVIVERMGYTEDDMKSVCERVSAADNRPHKSKPSEETLRNRVIMNELAHEIQVRGVECTAADIAEYYTDPDGVALSPKKIGAILRNALAAGLVSASPESWPVRHYGPAGFTEWSVKPKRKAKKKNAAEPTEDASVANDSDEASTEEQAA